MIDLDRVTTRCTQVILLLLAIVVACAGACGRKTNPRPPQFITPKPIADLQAENLSLGIQLTWARPKEYLDGSRMTDLAGFRVQRSDTGEAYITIATLEVTDRDRFRQLKKFKFQDFAVSEGMEYRYRVQSFTLDGYESEYSNEVVIRRVLTTPQRLQP